MSLLKKQSNSLEFLKKLFVDGTSMEQFKQLKLMADTDAIKSQKKIIIKVKKILSMPEFHLLNKNLILKIKSNLLNKNTQPMKLLQTLVAESITKEKDLKEFWNCYSKEISMKLWLPTQIDSPDSPSNYLSGCLTSMGPHSWISQMKNPNLQNKNCLKTSFQSLQFSQPDIMVKESIQYSRKIRIYPTTNQKIYFNKCFGTTRFFYNKALQFSKKTFEDRFDEIKKQSINGCIYLDKNNKQCCNLLINKFHCNKHIKSKIDWKTNLSLPYFRTNVMTNNSKLKDDELWQKEIPYDTRQLSIKNYISSLKGCLELKKNGQIDKFEMKYKSKKDKSQIFFIRNESLSKDLRLFPTKYKKSLRTRRKLKKWIERNIKSIDQDSSIIKEKTGNYYLCIPFKKKQIDTESNYNTVALDPGVRTFQTIYSSEGIVGKLGDNMVENIMDIGEKIDKLTSIRAKEKINKRKRKNLQKRMFKLRTKIKNIVKDLHFKTASFLCKNFKNIIIPKFDTQNMVSRLPYRARKISSKTARNMLGLSHYLFRQRLEYVASCYTDRKILICREDYT